MPVSVSGGDGVQAGLAVGRLVETAAEVHIPLIVVAEPGAFGAAMLAGVGAKAYPSVSDAVTRLVRIGRRFEPDAERGALYDGLLERIDDHAVAMS